jgi:hypothetical protein
MPKRSAIREKPRAANVLRAAAMIRLNRRQCQQKLRRNTEGQTSEHALHLSWLAVMTLTIKVDLPADLDQFRLPVGVAARLQSLLDRQDAGQPLTVPERAEAEGLTPIGRVTVAALAMNHPLIVAIRREEAARGRHPPT